MGAIWPWLNWGKKQLLNWAIIHLFSFSNRFILVKAAVDLENIPRTLDMCDEIHLGWNRTLEQENMRNSDSNSRSGSIQGPWSCEAAALPAVPPYCLYKGLKVYVSKISPQQVDSISHEFCKMQVFNKKLLRFLRRWYKQPSIYLKNPQYTSS